MAASDGCGGLATASRLKVRNVGHVAPLSVDRLSFHVARLAAAVVTYSVR
jgi:hypothetical protein